MRLETAGRKPKLPLWATLIVVLYLALVVASLCVERADGGASGACMFRRVTAQPCPTCGTTRMVLAISDGRWAEALRHNPLMFGLLLALVAALALRVGLRQRIVWITSPRARHVVTAALLLAVAANWVYLLART